MWLNSVLQNDSNHIQGERMLQVMTGRTTEECVLRLEPDLQEAREREEAKKSHTQAVRLKASLRRAEHSLEDATAVLASCTSASEVTAALSTRKTARTHEARARATQQRKVSEPPKSEVSEKKKKLK